MSTFNRKWLQTEMRLRGLYSGPIDGDLGAMSRAGLEKLFQRFDGDKPAPDALPWIEEWKKVFGLHEVRDNAQLKAWLKSDGKTLGDPAKLPWCGDGMETVVALSLPEEAIPANPYWALNWKNFGVPCLPCYGCFAAFERPSGGHIGNLVGEDDSDYYVLGANQGDAIGVTRLLKSRLRATRWSKTYPFRMIELPRMSPGNIPRSANEV